ncbi:MAG: ribosome-associated translation inhibitor RaiA [Oscillospiraceae bacterium]|jgi:putative sigma-54 modulation protein|nr:ribosome-associated translation inhibitor RaiA [Oscillospiraceae bacterium]
MKITVNERRVQVAPEIREYADKKISKLDRFFRNESEAQITFSLERGRYIAEVTLTSNGLVFRVTEATSDMHASIDSAVAAIERQIRKHKTRLAKRLRDGVFEHEAAPSVTGGDEEDTAEEPEFKIVRSKAFPIKPMTPEEAILQMNLLEHEFYVFKNQNHEDTFSVVYKRKHGDYGMIESL